MTYKIVRQRFIPYKNELDIKRLSSYNRIISSILDKYKDTDLFNVSITDRLKILDKTERLSLAIRASIEIEKIDGVENFVPEGYKLSQVAITLEGKILRIETPLTTLRNTSNHSYIASTVIAAMDVYEQENNIRFRDIFRDPVSIIQVRKITEKQYLGRGFIKDNNNEDSKIINMILYNKFLKSDNVYYLQSFTNTTRIVEDIADIGMEFIIFPSALAEFKLTNTANKTK